MKKLTLVFLLSSLTAYAQVGPRYAIEKYSKSQGLKLNPKAVKRLGIENKKIEKWPITVNEDAVVFIKDKTYIYLIKNDFYVLAGVLANKITGSQWEISGNEVKLGDVMVSKKAELIHLGQISNQVDD